MTEKTIQELQCEFSIEEEKEDGTKKYTRCGNQAEYVVRPKNSYTIAHFGRGIYCPKHADRLEKNAQGRRMWEVETKINSMDDLQKVDLSVDHPSKRDFMKPTNDR